MANNKRKIVLHNHAEKTHDATRLISSSIPRHRQRIEPFISLEVCRSEKLSNESLMSHSSGTAIITFIYSGEVIYQDSTGKNIYLKKNDVLCILSGSGISYSLKPKTINSVSIKLNMVLSPALEHAAAQIIYQESSLVERHGPAKILLGRYGDARSGFAHPALINYLLLTLVAGQSWTYKTPANHSVAWIAVIYGKINTSNILVSKEEGAFYEDSHESIDFVAIEDTIFLIGSSVQFMQDKLLTQKQSSNNAALQFGAFEHA